MNNTRNIKLLIAIFVVLSSFSMVYAASDSSTYLRTTFLNQDPDPAEPGKYVELRWRVTKTGGAEISNLVFLLEPEYPFSLDSGVSPEIQVGDWIGGADDDQYYNLYYKVRVAEDALEDTYTLNLKNKHGQNDWSIYEYEIRVGQKENPTFVLGNLVTSPKKLISDVDEAELNIELQNIGDGAAENVKLELILPEGFTPSYAYSTQDNLGTVTGGSSKTATFYLDIADAIGGGLHQADIKVSYKEENDNDNEYKSVIIPLGLPIKERAYFEIEKVESIPEQIHAGDDVELKIFLKNIGGDEGESVSIRAFKEASQPFEFEEKTDFIGKLAEGTTGEAVLKFKIDEDATAKEYLVELETRSIDGDEVMIQDQLLTVEIMPGQTKSAARLFTSPIAIMAIVAMLGFGGYKFVKRKD